MSNAPQPTPLGGHPVFRGFEALGVETIDIAHMAGVEVKRVTTWRSGAERLPGPWAILLTRLLGAWIRSIDIAAGQYTSAPDGDAAGIGASKVNRAENWLLLAEEANKDFPAEDSLGADKLADERARAGHAA